MTTYRTKDNKIVKVKTINKVIEVEYNKIKFFKTLDENETLIEPLFVKVEDELEVFILTDKDLNWAVSLYAPANDISYLNYEYTTQVD